MTVRVIVISEEDYAKLPKGLNILQEESHDSLEDYQIAGTIEDIHTCISNLEISEEEKQLLADDAYGLAVKFLNAYSFSTYNERMTEILMEEVAELRGEDTTETEDSHTLVERLSNEKKMNNQ